MFFVTAEVRVFVDCWDDLTGNYVKTLTSVPALLFPIPMTGSSIRGLGSLTRQGELTRASTYFPLPQSMIPS